MTTDGRRGLAPVGGSTGHRTVLIRAAEAPSLDTATVVDVRPGTGTGFDGDRHRGTLTVHAGGRVATAPATAPNALARLVAVRLPPTGPALVRFGDRRACRRAYPRAVVESIERRLRATARDAGAGFLVWTTGLPSEADQWRFDAVVSAWTTAPG